MNTTDEIMKLAYLLAVNCREYGAEDDSVFCARFALRTAIDGLVEQAAWAHHTPALLSDADAAADLAGVARPSAEPKAWSYTVGKTVHLHSYPTEHYYNDGNKYVKGVPLYTTPQASQLLTGWHIDALCIEHCGDDADPKPLYTPPQASQPEARPGAEPFGYVTVKRVQHHADRYEFFPAGQAPYLDNVDECHAVYTARPQASQPLTDDEIDQMWREATIKQALTSEFVRTFARAIEAAHGIGAAQPTQDAVDYLQGAANWLYTSTDRCDVSDIQQRLSIGYNRARRLLDAAIAAQKGKP